MKAFIPFFFFLLPSLNTPVFGQSSNLIKDSIYIDRGISGTTEFEPLYKAIYGPTTESGLPIELIIFQYENSIYQPIQKRDYEYEDDRISRYKESIWSESLENWFIIKEEVTTYENELIKTFLRKKLTVQGLMNDRLWEYSYNENDDEILVLLSKWNAATGEWENLSRKTTSYSNNEVILSQKLERFVNNEWRNVRQRIWRYGENGFQPKETIIQTWSSTNDEWVNSSRKTYSGDDGKLWNGTIIQEWDPISESWVNDIKEGFMYSDQTNTYNWEAQVWNDDWNKYLINEYLNNEIFDIAIVKEWDISGNQYNNKLRYGSIRNEQGIITDKIGMQTWSKVQETWLNQDFTRRIKYFYSEAETSSVPLLKIGQFCKIPNPFINGNEIVCEIEEFNGKIYLEITNTIGQTLFIQTFNQNSIIPDLNVIPGLYFFKIYDDTKIHHLEKIIIGK